MDKLKIDIYCPECGFSSFSVKDKRTKETFIVTIGKCPNGSCELVIKGEDPVHHENFEELRTYFESRFDLLEIVSENCA